MINLLRRRSSRPTFFVVAVESSGRCTVVASTDKADVGEMCEEDDSAPIKTGRGSVGKEDGISLMRAEYDGRRTDSDTLGRGGRCTRRTFPEPDDSSV